MSGDAPGSRRGEPEIISPWEWVTGAIGLVLVVAALAVMLREAAAPRTPPSLRATVDSVQAAAGGYLAHVTVVNRGTLPASAIVVEGELAIGADTTRRETTLEHLPAGAIRRVGLLFDGDPREGSLRVRALGYVAP